MRSNELKRKVNKINLTCPMVNAILDAFGMELDDLDSRRRQINDDMFFDTCSEDMLKFYEAEAGITPYQSDIDDRRYSLIAKWRASGHTSVETMQNIADSWKYGKTEIDFQDGKIVVTFTDKGIPNDLEGLKAALEDAKPAHLPIEYVYTYNTWNDVLTLTWDQAKTSTWDELQTR